MPGTTKDAIDIPFSKDGVDFVLIDTAGVRRKGRVSEITEKFSVVKALQAIRVSCKSVKCGWSCKEDEWRRYPYIS